MSKKNILKEAIADAEALKKGAVANAINVLSESMKENIRSFVESELNETSHEDTESAEMVEEEKDPMADKSEDMEDVELSEEEGEGEGEGEEMEDSEEEESSDESGDDDISEEDMREAIMSALSEVSHGGLGEPELVGPDSKHETGLADMDSKEEAFHKKTPPAAKDMTVKENAQLKAKVASLMAENVAYKKANQKLTAALAEVKTFNAKLMYVSKFMQNEYATQSIKKAFVGKLDSAKTIAEAKSIYDAFSMAVGLVSESIKSKKTKSSLSEALGTGASAGAGRNISESRETPKSELAEVGRWQKLAGIKKE
jgi:regulator of replication initiation timing